MTRPRRTRLFLAGVTVLVVVVATSLAYATTRSSASVPTGFYLDVGGSSSLGYQPTGTLTKDGALFDKPTDSGYANDLVTLEKNAITLTLHKIGCPGETVATLVGLKDHCYKLPTTQMSIALRILKAHYDETGIVSIDIGFNDVQPCIATAEVEESCANAARALIKVDLPKIVGKLKTVAGPHVHFIGVEYADPFLSRYVQGANEHAYATQTLEEITELDQVLTSVYAKENVAVVNAASVFSSNVTTPTTMTNGDVVPKNVAVMCADTYMCRAYPWGPDDHDDDAGYQALAHAMARVLPTSW